MNTELLDNSAQSIAKALGVTVEQARAGLTRNADAMRAYTDKDLKRMKKTRAEVNTMADDYERRAKCAS